MTAMIAAIVALAAAVAASVVTAVASEPADRAVAAADASATVTVVLALPVTTLLPTWRQSDVRSSSSPSLLPSPEDLPLLRPERAEDRLQGHASSLALHLRARQDRPIPHHGRVGQEAARTRQGDQARPLPRPAALRHRVRRQAIEQAAGIRPGRRTARTRSGSLGPRAATRTVWSPGACAPGWLEASTS